tara:strand:- start:555 stop:1199 length:645 start_codon:yes stop_codon:yes gene_type:complete
MSGLSAAFDRIATFGKILSFNCQASRANKPVDLVYIDDMAHKSAEIANEFLRKPGALGRLTQMQLQKLAYISHGWNLAINGEALVLDPVEAWDYGPVFPELYQHAKFFGRNPITREITPSDNDAVAFFLSPEIRKDKKPYQAKLSASEKDIIDRVWNRFGNFSAFQLSELTHKPDTPWYQTYFTRGKSAVINSKVIRSHYENLARLGLNEPHIA